jgi:hypothetical protein
LLAALTAYASRSHADDRVFGYRWPRWRVEAWGGDVFSGGGRWRNDPYAALAVEHEWMHLWNLSLGVRVLPVLVYGGDRPVVAGGLGIANRLYWFDDGSGLYLGPSAVLLASPGRFDGNSAYINFLTGLEVGYPARALPWRLSVKIEHASNANLAAHNRGWNGAALLLGWHFDRSRSN